MDNADRNFALEYRMKKQRWDQVRENVRETEDRQREKPREDRDNG